MASLDELKQAIQKNFLTPLSHLPDAQIRLLDTTHDQSVEDFQKAIAQLFGPTGAFEGQAALDLALLVSDYYAAEQKISDYAVNGVSERMSKLISICETVLTEMQPLMGSLQDGASWGAAGATFMQDEQQVNEEMPPGVENPIWDIAQLVMVVLAAGVFVWASSDQQTKVSELWNHLSQWENDMKTLGEQLEPALPHEPTQFAQDVTGDLPSLITAFTNSLPLTDTQKRLLEDVKSRLGDTPFNETDIEALIRAGYLDPDAIAAMIRGGSYAVFSDPGLASLMNTLTDTQQLKVIGLIEQYQRTHPNLNAHQVYNYLRYMRMKAQAEQFATDINESPIKSLYPVATQRLLERLNRNAIDPMQQVTDPFNIPDDKLGGLDQGGGWYSTLVGLEGEWGDINRYYEQSLTNPGIKLKDFSVPYANSTEGETDIIIEENGIEKWVEVKNIQNLRPRTRSWKGLRKQINKMIGYGAQNIVVDLPQGISDEMKKTLIELGKARHVNVEVRTPGGILYEPPIPLDWVDLLVLVS